jgi:hypothetical protein
LVDCKSSRDGVYILPSYPFRLVGADRWNVSLVATKDDKKFGRRECLVGTLGNVTVLLEEE